MKNLASFMALLCLLILTCCQQGTNLPENYQAQVCKELSESLTRSLEAWEKEDLEGYISFLDKDMLNMFSYGPAQNLEECRKSFRDVFDNYAIEGVKWEPVECIVDHNLAFMTTLFEQKWISNNKQDTISFKMRGIGVYRKQEDGSWKMFRLIGQQ
jgi:ketosteroid isomerase-like protein